MTPSQLQNHATRLIAVGVAILLIIATWMLPLKTQAILAPAHERFASPTGSGAPDECSQARPCPLQTALAQAVDGDRIYLMHGSYTGSAAQVVLLNKSIELWGGWSGAANGTVVVDPLQYETILDGQAARRVVLVSDNASPALFELTLQNGFTTEFGGGLRVGNSSSGSVLIDNCKILANQSGSYGGGIYLESGSLTVLNSTLADNSTTYGGGAIYVGLGASLSAERNRFQGNASQYGVAIHSDRASIDLRQNLIHANLSTTGNDCISINSTTGVTALLDNNIFAGNTCSVFQTSNTGLSVTIRHNTLVDNDGYGIYLGGTSLTATVMNNIIAHHTGNGLNIAGGSSMTVSNNLFYGNASNTTLGLNYLTVDPLLTGDFHLSAGSPAVDAGALTSLEMDFDGDPRPMGSLPDIGADERWLTTFLPAVTR